MIAVPGLQKTLDRLLYAILCLIPFIGLVTFDELIYPYVTSKHYLFRATIFTATALWGTIQFIDKSNRPRISALLGSFYVFLAIVLFADLLGSNFTNSFWSNYSRMEGFFSLIIFLLFVLILDSTLKNEKRWQTYWMIQVFVSVIVLIVAVLQKFGYVLAVDINRVDSVFGNSSYLAMYASAVFFLCLYLYFSFTARWLRLFILGAALCNLASIYLSQTRSATLGVLISLGVFLFSIAKNKKRTLLYFIGFGVLFIGSVFLFKSKSGVSTNLFERLASMSTQDGSIQARIAIWQYCIEAIQAQPWFGYGQENFSYLGVFYHPELWSTPWVDRSHNLFMEWWISSGIFGLGAFLLVLFLMVKAIWQADQSRLRHTQKLALISLLLCWFINQFLSIDFFSMSILFYSVLAFAHSLSLKKEPMSEPIFHRRAWILLIFLLSMSLYANYEINLKGYLTNYELRQVTKLENVRDSARVLPYKIGIDELAKESRPYEIKDVRIFMIQSALYILNEARIDQRFEGLARFYYAVADQELRKQMRDDPDALFFKHMAAAFYSQYLNFQMAESIYQELLQKVPRQQYFLIDYGHLKLAEGRPTEALKLYQQALELEPRFALARMFLAMGYVYNHQLSEGNALVDQMMKSRVGEVFDQRLINAYLSVGENKRAEDLVRFKETFYLPETK